MATTTTFSTLLADATNYLERGGTYTTDATVTAQIPRLINLAERRLMNILKLQGTLEVLTDPTGLTAGISVISKPDRWRVTRSMNYGVGSARTPLFPRAYEYCRSYWPDSTVTGTPKFYADYDYNHWLIVATPDQNYPLEIIAYMQPVLLDQFNQSNFFTELTPAALLYGTLLEATPFLKNDERIQVWQAYYEKELAALSGMDLQKMLDRNSERRGA